MTATQAPTPGPLSAEQISALVQEQMHDCWYEICSDTGCHPLDIVQLGRKRLEYTPRHWTRFVGDAVAARLAPLAKIGETPCLNSSCSSLSSSDGAGKSDAGSNPTAPVEVDCGTHGKVSGPICIRCAELGSPMGSADLEDKLHGTAMCPVGTVEWCGWATAEIERLRSPAPVEASGSEREHGPMCWGKTSVSDEMMYCYCGSPDARPLALGGQHSTATDFPPDDVLACVSDTTPARAEAQDEGAALSASDRACYEYPGKNQSDLRAAFVAGACFIAAHPSPTPAADADRVRKLETVADLADELINRGGLVNRGVDRGLVVVEKADRSDPHYRLCLALAALKSTAAKEGGAL